MNKTNAVDITKVVVVRNFKGLFKKIVGELKDTFGEGNAKVFDTGSSSDQGVFVLASVHDVKSFLGNDLNGMSVLPTDSTIAKDAFSIPYEEIWWDGAKKIVVKKN